MTMKKQAILDLDIDLDNGPLSDAAKFLVGSVLFGVPTIAGYAGYSQSKMRDRLNSDKDFEARKKKNEMYLDAIRTMQA